MRARRVDVVDNSHSAFSVLSLPPKSRAPVSSYVALVQRRCLEASSPAFTNGLLDVRRLLAVRLDTDRRDRIAAVVLLLSRRVEAKSNIVDEGEAVQLVIPSGLPRCPARGVSPAVRSFGVLLCIKRRPTVFTDNPHNAFDVLHFIQNLVL